MAIIKCPECGKEVSDTAKTCIHCGYVLKPESEEPRIQKKAKKTVNKKVLLIIPAIIIVAAIATLLIFKNSVIPGKKYKLAEEALESKDYDGAAIQFAELGGYKDSEQRVLECKYQKGMALLTKKDFSAAIDTFTELGDYDDAKIRIQECYYEKGKTLLAQNDYSASIEAFKKAGKYEDAEKKIQEAEELAAEEQQKETYNEVVSKFEAGELDEAQVLFASFPSDYEDTELYNTAITALSPLIGTYSVDFSFDLTGNNGVELNDGYVTGSITVGKPLSLRTSNLEYSDVDWGVDFTIQISTEATRFSKGTTSYNNTFTATLYHIIGDEPNDLSTSFILKDDSGVTILGYSGAYNKKLYFSFEKDSVKLIEIPYSYNWATEYYPDLAALVFNKEQ